MSEPKRGVIYLSMGNTHAVVLATSIHSLRKHWSGPITIFVCEPEGKKFAERIAGDEQCSVVEFKSANCHHAGYVNKTLICGLSQYDETLFIDADTIVCAPIDDLFYPAGSDRTAFSVTSFSDWTTDKGLLPGRLAKWRHVAPGLVNDLAKHPMPAVNTGVFSFTRECEQFLHAWQELTSRNPIFMCDEIACQLLLPKYPHRLLSDRFNCSPIYGGDSNKDAVIRHFHGKKHLRPEAFGYWWPAFMDALSVDVGGIIHWLPAGDQKLRTYLQTHGWPEATKEVA